MTPPSSSYQSVSQHDAHDAVRLPRDATFVDMQQHPQHDDDDDVYNDLEHFDDDDSIIKRTSRWMRQHTMLVVLLAALAVLVLVMTSMHSAATPADDVTLAASASPSDQFVEPLAAVESVDYSAHVTGRSHKEHRHSSQHDSHESVHSPRHHHASSSDSHTKSQAKTAVDESIDEKLHVVESDSSDAAAVEDKEDQAEEASEPSNAVESRKSHYHKSQKLHKPAHKSAHKSAHKDEEEEQNVAPKQHAPKQHAPKQHAPEQHAPKQHAPKQHAPKQHAPKQHSPKQHAPSTSDSSDAETIPNNASASNDETPALAAEHEEEQEANPTPAPKKSSHHSSAATTSDLLPQAAASATLVSPTDTQVDEGSSPLTSQACEPPYPGYPFCESKVAELQGMWKKDAATEQYYRSKGVDGSKCSFLTYLNLNGFYCPESNDWNRQKIRGVNLGGWLVLEPWIRPSLFLQFNEADKVVDQWTFCERLGKEECKRQLDKHWNEWLTLDDLTALAHADINHVRIPVGYWLFGDVQDGEPWVTGDLFYLERAIRWCAQVGLHVILDLHCAPGSQNGFDNSGRMGSIHFADSVQESSGRVTYPNIERALRVIDRMASHFSAPTYAGAVVGIELVNEAFITIPIEIVKDYYLQGYELVKKYGDIAVIIGDSFRFGSWNDFMFPPHYRHVWIDTHIYQVFDMYRLSFSWQQHLDQTCKQNKPEVSVAPLSTMVGEWSLATTDCARWLNGYQVGARFDGTYSLTHPWEHAAPLGSCIGRNDIRNTTVWTPEYRQFLREFAEKQMDAYESGSSAGWFFWNFKTEDAPQWNYLLGVREGWIPSDHSKRVYKCE